MKILILNSNNKAGGASKACYRLHASYLKKGIDATLLIKDEPIKGLGNAYNFWDFQEQKHRNETNTLLKKIIYKLKFKSGLHKDAAFEKEINYQNTILNARPAGLEVFTFSNAVHDITEHPYYAAADIIHLHFVAAHFLDYSFFAKCTKPIVWTLHDMNPFTGGCHYAGDCLKYENDCKVCPQLKGTINDRYAGIELQKKINALKNINQKQMIIASPSRWLMHCSEHSKALGNYKHQLVPYGIDSTIYKRRNKEACKVKLGLPTDKKVLLFVAYLVDNVRKGFNLLLEAIEKINKEDYVICTVGAKTPKTENTKTTFYQLGYIDDEVLLSEAYNAADVFVIPSLADNLPNTVLESLMCGTPVIAFPVGGIPDMVQHGENGLLCKNLSADALADCINEFAKCNTIKDSDNIGADAFKKYNEEVQINNYLSIYKELLHA
jgi:glycosyltransferase involved in cell wall biosynthesis